MDLNFKVRWPLSIFCHSKGIALILVLWVITILSVIVLEFCYGMRTEINITKNYKSEIQQYEMAVGGIERAIAELIYKHDPEVQAIRKTSTQEKLSSEQKEWLTDGRPYDIIYGNGSCEVRIISESGKININRISESLLRKIIGNLGLKEEERDILVDSILDWRDPDDFYRLNGAENDYYQSLKEPYRCKNGDLDSIEELLLVRGVTPKIFYGEKRIEKDVKIKQVGLRDIFTIYSMGEQIDINSANLLVLRYGLRIPEEISQQIIKARDEKPFENQTDLLRRIPELTPFFGEIGRLILYKSTLPYYTIEAKSKGNEEGGKRGLKAIVKIDRNEKRGYKVIQWIDAITE